MANVEEIIKCPNCGSTVEDGMKFCGDCGTPIPQEKKCPACGASVPLTMKFCGSCGAKMDGSGGGKGGVGIGDKNVIAGDVIGKKEQYSVSGNATIVHNQDESRKVLQCAVCGKHLLNAEAISCPKCGNVVCSAHFDRSRSCCIQCASNFANQATDEYKEALKAAYANGHVDFGKRKQLTALAQKLGLSKDEADLLERQFLNASGSDEEFLPHEKLAIEEAEKFLLADDFDSMSTKLQPLYKRLKDNERFISLTLRCLRKFNPDSAIETIRGINADFEASLEVEARISIDNADFHEAKKIIDKMMRLYPESPITHCVNVFYLNRLYGNEKSESIFGELKSEVEGLKDSQNPYEQKLITEARWCIEHPGWIFCKYESLPEEVERAKGRVNFYAEGRGSGVLNEVMHTIISMGNCEELKRQWKPYEEVAGVEFASFKGLKLSLDLSAAEEMDFKEEYWNNATALESIVLPKGIKGKIEEIFFQNENIKHITLSEGVTIIGGTCFYGCKALESVVFPSSLKVIEVRAFANCTSLKEITLPEGVKEIGDAAFEECSALEKVTFPSTLKTVGAMAFAACYSLKSVVIADNVGCWENTFESDCEIIVKPAAEILAQNSAQESTKFDTDASNNDDDFDDEDWDDEEKEEEDDDDDDNSSDTLGQTFSQIGKVYKDSINDVKDSLKKSFKDMFGGAGGIFGKKK